MTIGLKIIMVILIAGLLAGGLWYFYGEDLISNQPVINGTVVNNNVTNEIVNNEPPAPQPVPEVTDEALIRTASFAFAARYGSYSNDTRWQNIRDVYYLLTPRMQSVMDSLISSNIPQAGYYSVSTRPLFLNINSQSSTSAAVTVKTQKQETFSINGQDVISYQDLNLNLIKTGTEWQIDSAEWGK